MNLDNNQIVCGCFKVTVGDLKKAINDGDKTFEEVQKSTSVGKGCGKCSDSIKELVKQLQK